MNKVLRLLITSTICLATVSGIATVLPQSSDLRPAGAIVRPIADELDAWLDKHVVQTSALEMNDKEFKKLAGRLDDVSRSFVELKIANLNGRPSLDAAERIKQLIENDAHYKKVQNHPLISYLLSEYAAAKTTSADSKKLAETRLAAIGGRSCPEKSNVLKTLNDTTGQNLATDDFDKLLSNITRFEAKKFRKEALESFLDTLPQKYQEEFRAKLIRVVSPFPEILEDNKWLVSKSEATELKVNEPFKSLRDAEQASSIRHCRTAKQTLLRAIGLDKDKVAFAKVQQTADKVGGCFRSKGNAARSKFWIQIEPTLSKAYGFKGKELAKRNIGLLAWSRDDFKTAREIFTSLIDEAKATNHKEQLAESLFTLARIEENDSKIDQSLTYYQAYVTDFDEADRYLEALQAMVLLYSMKNKIPDSLSSAEKIIRSQDKKNLDDQDTSALSYALFWAGRLHFTLGNKSLAEEMWRRVASEYYSTFYGALGHFVLEKLAGKHLELEPSLGRKLDLRKFMASYPEADRKVFATTSALLEAGLKAEAACELAEVVIDDNSKEKILVKALYQHAAGEWLSSIINYSGLPRSFRNSLPVGFERILFPRAYVQEVSDYADKLNLDPDLVFAIIRQESVFNPKAMSGAGARGLMQLMPATARLESRHLGGAYLPTSERARLRQSARYQNNLFDADTNLALGVHHVHRLLAKYGNPIFLLTSYNANPRATERWMQNLPTDDYLAFIERIPYRETQAYVKLVLRNYFYYKRWYRPPTVALPHLDSLAQSMMKVASTSTRSPAH